MPALKNPRHEAFAQAILFGLLNSTRDTYSNGRAYQRAGYLTSNQNASDAAASRLLRKVKPILDRVRELQATLATETKETREKIIAELNQLNERAQAKDAYGAAVSAVLGKAKVLNLMSDQPQDTLRVDFNSAQSLQDIGRKLLQSIGFASPDDASIQRAIELNDTFIDGLQAIYKDAQALTVDQG
jgi:hypothetical protein